jgi:hypothetical protein
MGYPIFSGFDSAFLKCFASGSGSRETAGNALPCLRRVLRARRFLHRRLRIFVGTGLQFAFPAPVEQLPEGRAAAHLAGRACGGSTTTSRSCSSATRLLSGVGRRSISPARTGGSEVACARSKPSAQGHPDKEETAPTDFAKGVRSHEAKRSAHLYVADDIAGNRAEAEAGAMAIYHYTAKVISRSKVRSEVDAAAYRSATQLHDYHK